MKIKKYNLKRKFEVLETGEASVNDVLKFIGESYRIGFKNDLSQSLFLSNTETGRMRYNDCLSPFVFLSNIDFIVKDELNDCFFCSKEYFKKEYGICLIKNDKVADLKNARKEYRIFDSLNKKYLYDHSVKKVGEKLIIKNENGEVVDLKECSVEKRSGFFDRNGSSVYEDDDILFKNEYLTTAQYGQESGGVGWGINFWNRCDYEYLKHVDPRDLFIIDTGARIKFDPCAFALRKQGEKNENKKI